MFGFPISNVNAGVSIQENNNGNNFFSVLNILDNNWEYVKSGQLKYLTDSHRLFLVIYVHVYLIFL